MPSDEIQNLLEGFGALKKALEEAEFKVKEKTTELESVNKKLINEVEELGKTKLAVINLLEDLEQEKDNTDVEVRNRTRELSLLYGRFDAFVQSAPLGFIMLNEKCQLINVNPVAKELFNLSPYLNANLDVESIEKFLPPTLALGKYCRTVLTGKKATELKEIEFGNKILRTIITPIVTLGQPIGLVIMIEDITAARLLERSRENFFAMASHELRTPLTTIRGNMAIVRDYYPTKLKSDDLKRMVLDTYDASIRLISIVNDFLDTAALEQGKLSVKPEVLNLKALINQSLKDLTPLVTAKNLKLIYKNKTDVLPYVLGDPVRVKQVLDNLIGNAISYTQKGEVSVEARIVPGFLEVLVSDTGVGISAQHHSLLFKKFQQAGEKVYTRSNKGTGLGLYISKLLIEQMGGQIQLVASRLGKGSTFSFTLPLAK